LQNYVGDSVECAEALRRFARDEQLKVLGPGLTPIQREKDVGDTKGSTPSRSGAGKERRPVPVTSPTPVTIKMTGSKTGGNSKRNGSNRRKAGQDGASEALSSSVQAAVNALQKKVFNCLECGKV
jgi:hypothetical protein